MHNEGHTLIDFSALALLLGTVTQVLPPVAAFLSILWLLVRIVESSLFRAIVKSSSGYDVDIWLHPERHTGTPIVTKVKVIAPAGEPPHVEITPDDPQTPSNVIPLERSNDKTL